MSTNNSSNDKSVKIVYLRDRNRNPIGCVAMRIDDNKTVKYQCSVLNKKVDKFNKTVAKRISIGRLNVMAFSVKLDEKHNSYHEIMSVVMEDIYKNKELPTRANKSAKLWLSGDNRKCWWGGLSTNEDKETYRESPYYTMV